MDRMRSKALLRTPPATVIIPVVVDEWKGGVSNWERQTEGGIVHLSDNEFSLFNNSFGVVEIRTWNDPGKRVSPDEVVVRSAQVCFS